MNELTTEGWDWVYIKENRRKYFYENGPRYILYKDAIVDLLKIDDHYYYDKPTINVSSISMSLEVITKIMNNIHIQNKLKSQLENI